MMSVGTLTENLFISWLTEQCLLHFVYRAAVVVLGSTTFCVLYIINCKANDCGSAPENLKSHSHGKCEGENKGGTVRSEEFLPRQRI